MNKEEWEKKKEKLNMDISEMIEAFIDNFSELSDDEYGNLLDMQNSVVSELERYDDFNMINEDDEE
jgi:hypothetical protein